MSDLTSQKDISCVPSTVNLLNEELNQISKENWICNGANAKEVTKPFINMQEAHVSAKRVPNPRVHHRRKGTKTVSNVKWIDTDSMNTIELRHSLAQLDLTQSLTLHDLQIVEDLSSEEMLTNVPYDSLNILEEVNLNEVETVEPENLSKFQQLKDWIRKIFYVMAEIFCSVLVLTVLMTMFRDEFVFFVSIMLICIAANTPMAPINDSHINIFQRMLVSG